MKEEYNKEEYIARKRQERKETYEKLDEATKGCQSDWEWLNRYCEIAARFPFYSVSNCLLICHQYPKATTIASYKGWKERGVHLERNPMPIKLIERGKTIQSEDGKDGCFWDIKNYYDIKETDSKEKYDRPKEMDMSEVSDLIIKMSPCAVKAESDDTIACGRICWYDQEENTIYMGLNGTDNERTENLVLEICKATLASGENEYEEPEFLANCMARVLCHRFSLPVKDLEEVELPKNWTEKEPCQARQLFRIMRDNIRVMDQQLDHNLRGKEMEAIAR